MEEEFFKDYYCLITNLSVIKQINGYMKFHRRKLTFYIKEGEFAGSRILFTTLFTAAVCPSKSIC